MKQTDGQGLFMANGHAMQCSQPCFPRACCGTFSCHQRAAPAPDLAWRRSQMPTGLLGLIFGFSGSPAWHKLDSISWHPAGGTAFQTNGGMCRSFAVHLPWLKLSQFPALRTHWTGLFPTAVLWGGVPSGSGRPEDRGGASSLAWTVASHAPWGCPR